MIRSSDHVPYNTLSIGPRLTLNLAIRDPMDPKFDLEAYFQTLMKENP